MTTREQTSHLGLDGEKDGFFSLALDLLCIRGADGFFKQINPAFTSVLGRSREELLSRPIRDFVHPDDVRATEQAIATVVAGGGRTHFEDRWICADGSERTLAWWAIVAADGEHIYAIARDVTSEKQPGAELGEAKRLAEEADIARSAFLARMSHEIRTPLNGIIGMTELALDTRLTAEQREYLEMVHGSAGALLETINDILDFSKIDAGKLELERFEFPLWETVTSALRPLSLMARSKGIDLVYSEGSGIPERVMGDPGRLRQTLINLVGNAVKFTESGAVTVTIGRAQKSAAPGEVALRFAVADTGIGIPADKLDHIFGSFNQVDSSMTRRFGGTGLGLTIAAGIVDSMGGTMSVESEEGLGSTFTFEATFGEADAHGQPMGHGPDELNGLRVLAVDVADANLRVMVDLLERKKMVVTVATSAAEALAALDVAYRDAEPIDLMVFDCHMRGAGGFELAAKVRDDERFEDLVLVAVTSEERPGDGALCQELGIASYLLRPLAPSELRDALLLSVRGAASGADHRELVTRHSLSGDRRALRVLLAEDNQVNQRLAMRLLERLGHRFRLAATGGEVLGAHAEQDFDVILMDIQMPEMDGVEATRRIRAREAEGRARTPIIAITAHAMAGDRERFLAAGMDDYISKPIDRHRLRAVLRTIARTAIDRPAEASAALGAVQGEERDDPDEGPREKPSSTFDRGVLLKHTDGDVELIRTLVGVFENDHRTLLANVASAAERAEMEDLYRAAHTIKGALGVFGAFPAASHAEAIERAARDGSIEDGPARYAELDTLVLDLMEDLRRFADELD